MSLSHEIQPVAWAEMQAHFMHTFAYGLAISEMAIFHAIRTCMRAAAWRSRKFANQRSKTSVVAIFIIIDPYLKGYKYSV